MSTATRYDLPDASGGRLLFEVVAVAAVVLVLLGRRRWPFGAPAAMWTLSTAVSFYDGELIPSQPAVYLAGMAAALMLGNLRSERLGAGRAGDRAGQRGDRGLQHRRPRRRGSRVRPAHVRHRLAHRLRAPGARRADRGRRGAGPAGRAGPGVRRATGRRRGAHPDRAGAARRGRARDERDGAPGGRGPAQAARGVRRAAGGAAERRADGADRPGGDAPAAGRDAVRRRRARARSPPGPRPARGRSWRTSAPPGST